MALKKTKTKLHENIVQTLINNLFIRQCVFIKIWSMQEVWVHKRCIRVAWGAADVWTDCFITFSTRWKIFFLRDLLADVMSMHNRNMKHACTIEFDWTNLLAYNFTLSLSWLQEGLHVRVAMEAPIKNCSLMIKSGTTPLGKWKCYRYMWDLKSMYIHNRNEWSVKKRCLIVPSSLTQSILKNYFCIYVTMCYMPTFKARGDFYITRDKTWKYHLLAGISFQ